MTSFLLLLAATPAAEVAPAPSAVPDAAQIATWVRDLSSPDHARRPIGMTGLVKAGPRAKDAVPELIKFCP